MTTAPPARPQMVFFPAPEAERLTGLGAELVDEVYNAPIRLSHLTDPEGNRLQLASFKPEQAPGTSTDRGTRW